jgi:hypothetical protein
MEHNRTVWIGLKINFYAWIFYYLPPYIEGRYFLDDQQEGNFLRPMGMSISGPEEYRSCLFYKRDENINLNRNNIGETK